MPTPTFSLAFRSRVVNILRHSRTISGHRDPVSGAAITETIDLGWFVHLQPLGNGHIEAYGVGPNRPEGIAVGDIIIHRLSSEK